jgi:hypothetical protein
MEARHDPPSLLHNPPHLQRDLHRPLSMKTVHKSDRETVPASHKDHLHPNQLMHTLHRDRRRRVFQERSHLQMCRTLLQLHRRCPLLREVGRELPSELSFAEVYLHRDRYSLAEETLCPGEQRGGLGVVLIIAEAQGEAGVQGEAVMLIDNIHHSARGRGRLLLHDVTRGKDKGTMIVRTRLHGTTTAIRDKRTVDRAIRVRISKLDITLLLLLDRDQEVRVATRAVEAGAAVQ